jgi:hypothetical protein
MLKWSTKNKLVKPDSHLNTEGHDIFSNILDNKIINKFDISKKYSYI